MAKKVHESYLKITGDNKSALASLDGISKKMGSAERSIRGFGNGISGTLGSVTGMFTSLPFFVSTATAGLVAFATKGISSFREFDKGLRNVNTIIGVSGEQLQFLGDQVEKIAVKYGVSAEELTNSLYQATSAGIETGKAISFLEAATQASIAGVSSTTEAVDVLTTILNSYHLEVSKTTEVSDILFQTVKLGKTTFSELASSLNIVSPLAAASGIEFEQVAAAIATLTKQGVPTAQAITQIRASIVAMNDVLGDGWAKTMTLQEGLSAMAAKGGGSNTELKNMVGRIEAVSAILATTGENAFMASMDLDSMNQSIGATQKALGEQEGSVDLKMNRFSESIKRLQREASQSNFLAYIIDDVTHFINQVDALVDNPSLENIFKFHTFQDIDISAIQDLVIKAEEVAKKNQEAAIAARQQAEAARIAAKQTEEQKKEAERLAKQWESISVTLKNDIATAGLPKAYQEFVKIDQKVAELKEKFGDLWDITDWEERMKVALFDKNSIPIKITPYYESTDTSGPLTGVGFDRSFYDAQIAAITEVTDWELANLTLRQQGTLDTFSNMSQAALMFFQSNEKQHKGAFKLYKTFAVAETAIATYQAATEAYKSMVGIPIVGPGLAVAAAAAATAFGLARINAINSQTPGGGYSSLGAGSITQPTTNYNSNTTNNSPSITINIQSSYKDPAAMVREDLIPEIEKHFKYGGTIKFG